MGRWPLPDRMDLAEFEGPRTGPLYGNALSAPRTGPLFNAFSYPTKISPETIALFVACHTRPGDTVLDVFAGSGTTGVAVKLCDAPTQNMLRMAVELGLEPEWGPRHAELYDVGTLPAFIARVITNPPDPERFRVAAESLLEAADARIGHLYRADSPAGDPGLIRHVIWSEVLRCPQCDAHATYWDAAVRRGPLTLSKSFTCPECHSSVTIDECERVIERVFDPVLESSVDRRVRVPARVFGTGPDGLWQRDPAPSDLQIADAALTLPIPSAAPRVQLDWGDLHRRGYHYGMTHAHHLYTHRNFLVVATLWDLIGSAPHDLRDALRFLVLSFNGAHSTLMTRVVVKRGAEDFALTGAQSGVLYVSGLPVEKNILLGLGRKVRTLERAFAAVVGSTSTVRVTQRSSADLALGDRSVDYVFTDPPFGGYIPYAEVNEINEVWLGARTDRAAEAIVSPAAGKDVDAYGRLMGDVFREIRRVLKPAASATVVFHSAHADVWSALRVAFGGAGFAVHSTGLLNKTQASFKQVVSTSSVKGDPVIELRARPRGASGMDQSLPDAVDAVMGEAVATGLPDELTPERLYSRYILRCLVEDVPVASSAKEFYELVEAACLRAAS